jgi:adenine-specific DNA-methyltransferase
MSRGAVPKSATVYTPECLARAMVRAAGGTKGCEWLDPCVGDGAFVAEMSALGVPRERIRALDISPSHSARDRFARTQRGVDFIEWGLRHVSSVDRVVLNPPYVALSRLRGAPLKRALQVPLADGTALPFKANYWCAFLLRAVECLRPGGVLVAVLPASWEFARYAGLVRESVRLSFRELSVIRCTTPLFPTVQDGAVVLVARGRGEIPRIVRRVEVDDLDGMTDALESVALGRVPGGAIVVRTLTQSIGTQVRLDHLIDIRIGAVTGDATYFLLTEDDRLELGLTMSAVRPVLSRSRHLTVASMDHTNWARLRDAGARVWLFRPTDAVLKHKAVKRYLREGKDGACNIAGFKISSRELWHRTPLPGRVDGFLSGMSKRLPFLVLRDMNRLSATNTLYVVSFKDAPRKIDRAALGIVLLTSSVRRELARHARIYADGLLKFEPSELGSVRVPVVKARADASRVFQTATALLLAGKESEAEALADAWVARDRANIQRPVVELRAVAGGARS